MIIVRDLCKSYPTRNGPRMVLQDVNLDIYPGEKIGILGRNGAGKSTMIRLLGGVENPTQGSVTRLMSVSWPLAFSGAFQTALTGLDNLRFICRVYGVEPESKIPFVEDFSELGRYLREPVNSYSSGMQARLAFAISMTIEFDCFLIDEIIAVGDQRFHDKCHIELFEKRADRAMIFVSHDIGYIQAHCQRAAVLDKGFLRLFEDVAQANEFYAAQ